MNLREIVPPHVVRLVLYLFVVFLVLALVLEDESERLAVDTAFEWLQRLIGIVVLLWSGREAARAWEEVRASRVLGATPAITGALAGGLLLGIGAWATPAALGLVGVMEGVVRWKGAKELAAARTIGSHGATVGKRRAPGPKPKASAD